MTMLLAAVSTGGQQPDSIDTLITRSGKNLMIPRWDTVKQLEQINQKADTILYDLSLIKKALGIKNQQNDRPDTNQTCVPPRGGNR